jgi:hypothetical protein
MTAAGTMTLAGDSTPRAAKLNVLGTGTYRLDVARDTGTDSTILNGTLGTFIAANGKQSDVSASVAAAGIVSVLRLFASGYPQASTTLPIAAQRPLPGRRFTASRWTTHCRQERRSRGERSISTSILRRKGW